MRRTGFAPRPRPERQAAPLRPIRAVAPTVISTQPATQPKDRPARHEGYRRLVAALPCALCQRPGHSQAAHPNTGKGMSIKADDRLCFPLCADTPGLGGCHTLFDQGAYYPREQRRAIEQLWTAQTVATITAAGQWPADLEPLTT